MLGSLIHLRSMSVSERLEKKERKATVKKFPLWRGIFLSRGLSWKGLHFRQLSTLGKRTIHFHWMDVCHAELYTPRISVLISARRGVCLGDIYSLEMKPRRSVKVVVVSALEGKEGNQHLLKYILYYRD